MREETLAGDVLVREDLDGNCSEGTLKRRFEQGRMNWGRTALRDG